MTAGHDGRGRGSALAAAALVAALLVLGALLGACGGDGAEPSEGHAFRARLAPLNGSGVRGSVDITRTGSALSVRVEARGLERGQEHVQHVHRRRDGRPGRCPRGVADDDRDGTLSLREALPAYGPVALPLLPFPRADAEGRVSSDVRLEASDGLGPLTERVVAMYGLDVSGVYDPTVPVACARIRRKS